MSATFFATACEWQSAASKPSNSTNLWKWIWTSIITGATEPVSSLTSVADSLPGLGIVAAVLGVVITMSALGGPPEEIGHKVAAALVGTFLGILLCYGFLGPLASNLAKMNDAETDYLRCLRQGVIAFVRGSAPVLAVEFARRSVPGELRPSFQELEAACRKTGTAAPPPPGL